MRVLVTGDRGYIGPVLVDQLLQEGCHVIGFDIDYYSGTELFALPTGYKTITKDIRDIERADLEGIDAVIHLAGLSNDPLGELAPNLTHEINYQGTLRIAEAAKSAGVKRFIYASSQSMYGISNTSEELDEDLSEKNPVTSYAATKWEAELALKKMAADEFTVVCFRPSTVFGVAPRLRTDIVFNNFVACAYTTGKIEIKSDGTPWRPVIHVRDVASAFIAGLKAPISLVANQSYNVGIHNGNYSVRDLAEAAQAVVPGSKLIFTGEHGSDSRTYKVSFNKILTELKDYYHPEWSLRRGGQELVNLFDQIGFTKETFIGDSTNRLSKINQLIFNGTLDKELREVIEDMA